MVTDLSFKPIYHCHHHSDKTMAFIVDSATHSSVKRNGTPLDDFDVLVVDGFVDLCRGEVDEYNPDLKEIGTLSFEVLMLSLMSDKV